MNELLREIWLGLADQPERCVLRDGDSCVHARKFVGLSASFAQSFAEQGVRRGDRVLVSEPRGARLLAAVLALLTLGAVLVPVGRDSSGLLLRRARVAKARFIFGNAECEGLYSLKGVKHRGVAFDAHKHLTALPSEREVYLHFTSGSTGEPKGVSIGAHNAGRRIRNAVSELGLSSDSHMLLKTPVVFDVAILEMLSGLLSKSTLEVLPSGHELNSAALVDIFERIPPVSGVVHFVPSALDSFCRTVDGSWATNCVRIVHTSGEAVSVQLARKALEHFKGATFINMYGQTETSEVSIWRGGNDDLDAMWGWLPAGYAIGDYEIAVVDDRGCRVPPGAVGQVSIGGRDALADAYVLDEGRVDLAERTEQLGDRRGRWYRTGDLGTLGSSGLSLQGRSSGFAKVNGARVELGALEHVVGSLDGVRGSVAWVRDRSPLSTIELVVIGDVSPETVDEWIRVRLPASYRPSRLDVFEKGPLTPTGKLDRIALREGIGAIDSAQGPMRRHKHN